MTFAHPVWFVVGIAVLALLAGYVLAQFRTRRHTLRFANLELLESVAPRRPGRLRHLPTAVVLLGLALLTVALAGPTAAAKVPRNKATVMLVIDVSLSMQSSDVSPNRLAAAQAAATEFATNLTPGVNLGIESFSGIATVLVSPTVDRNAAREAIAGLKLDERTASGDAIVAAVQSIQGFDKTIATAGGDTDKPPPSRIVLMTDGKQTTGRDAVVAAAAAKTAGIPISVIAFGTTRGTITNDGTVIPVPLDSQAIRQMAQASGGDFHTAATADELRSVYAQLGEQIGFEIKQQDVSRPWMIAGTILLLLGAAGALVIGGRIP